MAFSEAQIEAVWNKRRPPRTNPDIGYDVCRAEIHFDEYGEESGYGWEIDHILPESRGGRDNLSNLQPLYWKNNRIKGDQTQQEWRCRDSHKLMKK